MLFLGACVAGPTPKDAVLHEKTENELAVESSVVIGEAKVTGALNKFILIKKDGHTCAVKFTAFHRDYDAKPASRISSGEENTYADYEWFYQEEGSGGFTKSNVLSGKGKLHRGPTVGVGFDITIWRSADKWWIECGAIKLGWLYPTTITFSSYESGSPKLDYKLEMAPTNWSQVREISINNSKLTWAKLNAGLVSRPDVRIPLSDLP